MSALLAYCDCAAMLSMMGHPALAGAVMSLRQRYLKVLTDFVPVGAASLSLLIGSAAFGGANPQLPKSQEPSEASVSEKLGAIRGAVSDIVASDVAQERRLHLAAQKQPTPSTGIQQVSPPKAASPRWGNQLGGMSGTWNKWNNVG
jgi:hypothetical protein